MKTLIIWMHSGETLKFEHVREFTDSGDEVTFVYDGVSTGETRAARFSKNGYAGEALTYWENEDDSN